MSLLSNAEIQKGLSAWMVGNMWTVRLRKHSHLIHIWIVYHLSIC